MKTNKYYESHIKCDVLEFLRKTKNIDARSVLASEYVLGSTGRRADLAIFTGSKFIGIEIKSQHDSLSRLKDQLDVYAMCFDEVMVVLDGKHISYASEIASADVSVFEVSRLGTINLHRASTVIPAKDKATCLRLLTMNELRRLTGLSDLQMKKNKLIDQALLLPDETIYSAITTSFKQNFSNTSLLFWEKIRRKNITINDLAYLSRFALERTNFREKEEQKSRFWEKWQQDASSTLQALGH